MINTYLRPRSAAVAVPAQATAQASSDEMLAARIAAGDRLAMNALMTRLSALVEVVPELIELELNPVKVLAPGDGAIVLDGRMRVHPRA